MDAAKDDQGPADPPAAALPPAGPGDALAERLERRVVAYWYLTDLLRAAVLATILVVGAGIWHERDRRHAEWAPTAAMVLSGCLVALALVVPPLTYARWSFAADDRLLRMRYGILFVEERLVPVPRMQHVDLVRGPIERLFGLATLVVFTAGNEGSAFRVPGLALARAQGLRDRILKARGDDRL